MPGMFIKAPKRGLNPSEAIALVRKWNLIYEFPVVKVRGKYGKVSGSAVLKDGVPLVPVDGFYVPMLEIEINPDPQKCPECKAGTVEVYGIGFIPCLSCQGTGFTRN